MTVGEVRKAAYATIAAAMLGEPLPSGRLFHDAVAVVLFDTRKSRTAAERAVQSHLAISLTIFELTQTHGGGDRLALYADRLRHILGATLGEEPVAGE